MERNVIVICFAKILVGHSLISFKDLALKILKQRRAGINTVTMFVIWRPPDEEKKKYGKGECLVFFLLKSSVN